MDTEKAKKFISSNLGQGLLIAIIFEFALKPIFAWTRVSSIDGSITLSNWIDSQVYSIASTGDNNSAILLLLQYATYGLIGYLMYSIADIYKSKQSVKTKGHELLNSIDELIERLTKPKEKKEFNLEEELQSLGDMKARVMGGLHTSTVDRLSVLLGITGLVGVTVLLSVFWLEIKVNSVTVRFRQALQTSAPYLTETDRLTLASRFAQMKSKSDYQRIIGDLDKVANAHKSQGAN